MRVLRVTRGLVRLVRGMCPVRVVRMPRVMHVMRRDVRDAP
jgi:hypothetical protein